MSDIERLEKRLTELEREFADFKKSRHATDLGEHWLLRMMGAFKDDPDFDEIVRLGQEYRKSQTFETHG